MSAQAATALYERLSSDQAFRSQLEAAATPEEKKRIVTEAGYDLSRDDLPTIRSLAGVNELSDEDLENVAAAGVGTDVGAGFGGFFVAIAALALGAAMA